ncbi:LysR family transcriptional regulator [Alicyclobacillus fastidiosus]|uniref:LysR family transcriptional regulator n=1 Tax=Alicyclobacillus fastidiosus TaxID=392011 RepID=A0ABY6ZM14_9BACL|nr:LysR family transcriptional regulator [Alicyclobacillus fastidiosus]WAH43840.1 LysR family transcriptional regulator [Alicyclobacillus fastidiosus]GMA60072.1 putative HTH-type transcriptional regulator YybE [Alicyclobacillus fastidiosus]
MDWSKLEYFRTVARTQHFTRAAELLSLSQPALSRAMASLEQELGTTLFDRQGRNVVLNEYGKTFLEYVEKALRTMDEGKTKIQEMLGVSNRSVSLAFLPTLGLGYVPQLVKEFNRDHPDVQIQLWQNPHETIIKQLKTGDIDLGLCLSPVKESNLDWRELFSEELYVIVPTDHRLASKDFVQLTDIADEPFIGMKHGTGLRIVMDELFDQAGFSPRIAFEGEEVPTIAGLVGAGLGVSLTPYWSGLDLSSVRLLRVSEPVCRRTIGIAWVADKELSLVAMNLKEHILEYGAFMNRCF